MYGPTVGDKVRLADTDLLIEVERDFTLYGEEVKFGGGKVIRDGMGQSQATRAEGAVDTVITNALILDHSGIYKADIGLRDGRIAAIGKAGNPDTQNAVTIIIGPSTEIIAGEGKIITAGGVDSHIHFIAPQQIEEALYSGITTMPGGGTGPAHGTLAATFSPELADITLYVIAVCQGEKIPRKGGPAITKSDLLIINKTDLAPHVMADLAIMESDTQKARNGRPYVFTDLLRQKGLADVVSFLEKHGGLTQAAD